MGSRLLLIGVLAAAGCRFDAPGYDGTTYACEAPRFSCPPGFACVAGWCVPPGAEADVDAAPPLDAPTTMVVAVAAGRDTTILSAAPATNDGARVGLEIDADPPKATLMYFDLSALPADAVVEAAELSLSVFDPIETGSFVLRPLTESWREDGATWEEREPGVPWSAPGAAPPASDDGHPLADLAPREIGPATAALDPAAVQAWASSPASNHGFVIISTSPDGRGGQVRSREWSTPEERPILRVTYRAP